MKLLKDRVVFVINRHHIVIGWYVVQLQVAVPAFQQGLVLVNNG